MRFAILHQIIIQYQNTERRKRLIENEKKRLDNAD